jgi:hypothetical protein
MIPVTVPEGMRPGIILTNVVLSDLYGNTVPVRLGQTRVSVAAAPTSFSLQDLATARIFPTAAEFDSVRGEGAWVEYLEWAEEGIIKRETEIREYLPELSTR